MKKVFVLMMGALLVLSSCGSYNEATGAYAGANLGSIVGTAIGGITGGRHGHEWGTLIGTVGGAVAGAAAGKAVDQAQEKKYQQRVEQMENRRYGNSSYGAVTQGSSSRRHSGYFDNSDGEDYADDRIDFDNSTQGYPDENGNYSNNFSGSYSGGSSLPALEIRNAVLTEGGSDKVLRPGEECLLTFEIRNLSDQTVYDVKPFVEEVTGNRHIHISRNISIGSIGPRQGVRYKATVKADSGLKKGEAVIQIGAVQGLDNATQVQHFRIVTARR